MPRVKVAIIDMCDSASLDWCYDRFLDGWAFGLPKDRVCRMCKYGAAARFTRAYGRAPTEEETLLVIQSNGCVRRVDQDEEDMEEGMEGDGVMEEALPLAPEGLR